MQIETLQNKAESHTESYGVTISPNVVDSAMATATANLGGDKQDKAWVEQPAEISATDTLHVHAKQVTNVGGVLSCAKQAKPIFVVTDKQIHAMYQYTTPADGDCAFHALGIARAMAAKQLLAARDDVQIRALVAAEIAAELIAGMRFPAADHLPKSMQPEKVAALRAELLTAELALERSAKRIRGNHGVAEAIPAE